MVNETVLTESGELRAERDALIRRARWQYEWAVESSTTAELRRSRAWSELWTEVRELNAAIDAAGRAVGTTNRNGLMGHA